MVLVLVRLPPPNRGFNLAEEGRGGGVREGGARERERRVREGGREGEIDRQRERG